MGALLRRPWELVREHMLAGLHARGFDDLTAAHLNVLQYPGPHGARPSELAVRARMSRQALNYLLGQMEQLGYVERRSGPGDGTRRVHLTARGHAAMAAIRELVAELERQWAERLGRERFRELRELLVELNAVVVRDDA